MEAVTVVSDGKALLEALVHNRLDVAVIDMGSFSTDRAVELVGMCSGGRSLRCAALMRQAAPSAVERMVRAGVAAVVSTRTPISGLGEAIRTMQAGRTHVCPEVAHMLTHPRDGSTLTAGSAISSLTTRERRVLRLIADGHTSRQIAGQLGISMRTVDTHRISMMKKLGARKASALVRLAVREGLVET
jgi:DNA-binding NarL/FixJ family response regulator